MPPEVKTMKATTDQPNWRWGRWLVACVLAALLMTLTTLLPQHGTADETGRPATATALAHPDSDSGGHGHAADRACHASVGCVQLALAGTDLLPPQPSNAERIFVAVQQAPLSLRPAPDLKPPIT